MIRTIATLATAFVALLAIGAGVARSMGTAVSVGPASHLNSACTRTSPEYRVHAGGTNLVMQLGTTRFTVLSKTTRGYDAPYLTTGYNEGISTSYTCRGYGGHLHRMPVLNGKQGRPVVDLHTSTSSDFRGDTGYDIWYSRTGVNTYNQLADGGGNVTEIMIWTSHPKLATQSSALRYYPVIIDGRHWQIRVGLASQGHGRTGSRAGWIVVNFIAPSIHRGNVTVSGLHLNAFASYAIARGWLNPRLNWTSINAGAELSAGRMSVAGYRLTGLPYER